MPHVVGHLDERPERSDAGVGDEHVDTAELALGRFDQLAHVAGRSGVGLERDAWPTELVHHLDRLVELLPRAHRRGHRDLPGDVADHDARAFAANANA